ncbi:MAG: hypothetical protein ACRDTD_31825 [Pseudonocardiaceae bacterium]
MRFLRGVRVVPSRQRLDAVAVLAERESRLSGVRRIAPRAHHHLGQWAVGIEARVCELRRSHLRWGPRRLVHERAHR